MFDFLKTAQPVIDDVEATGTYADAFLQIPKVELRVSSSHERDHLAYVRDYGSKRTVSQNVLGFA